MRLLTREALLSFRRAPLLSALSITTIAFSLFTIGLFGLVAINLREALRGIEERVEIVAFVFRGTPAETIALATQDIAAFPEVSASPTSPRRRRSPGRAASWSSSATPTATCR